MEHGKAMGGALMSQYGKEATPPRIGLGHRNRRRKGVRPGKVGKVLHEFKHGELHSGSKTGPKVTNPKQALAIGLAEKRKGK